MALGRRWTKLASASTLGSTSLRNGEGVPDGSGRILGLARTVAPQTAGARERRASRRHGSRCQVPPGRWSSLTWLSAVVQRQIVSVSSGPRPKRNGVKIFATKYRDDDLDLGMPGSGFPSVGLDLHTGSGSAIHLAFARRELVGTINAELRSLIRNEIATSCLECHPVR
jgi:hypothetical protein